jgi:hypothetical protein
MTDEDEVSVSVEVNIKGELLLDPPPRDALSTEILDTLSRYPNGMAECIVEIDGRKLFFICGRREENTIQVDVWDRDEAEAMYKNAGILFFKGRA